MTTTTRIEPDTRDARASGHTRHARHWIDGQWVDAGSRHDSVDPATGERTGTYALGGAAEAEAAVAAA
jgi:hypothetical protein